MPLFDYTGQLRSGAGFTGTLEADSPERAQAMLADMGVRVTSLRAARRTAYVAPLSLDDLLFFNEQLAGLAKSAIPLEEGLRHLAADVGSPKLKRLLRDLSDDLTAGMPLEQALDKQRHRFPTQYPDVIRAGLKTGDLAGTLYGVTAHLRLKGSFRRVLIELAAYPVVVLAMALLVVSFFMHRVMPELLAIVMEFQREWRVQLPPVVEFVAGLTRAWPAVEVGILVFVAVVVVALAATWLPGGRAVREWLLRHIPGFANVYWSSVLARFTHTSALAAYSATPLPDLIAASGAASGSVALARATRRVADRIQEGTSLEAAASQERDLPALWRCVVATGSQRGGLAAALAELARAYELRAQQWVNTVRIILGPLLLVLLGLVLGGAITMVFFVLGTLANMMQLV